MILLSTLFVLKCVQFYSDTVKKMALKQLIAGSPLRTLCLLIAGQPADVFSDTNSQSSVPNSLNVFQQPSQVMYGFSSYFLIA